VADPRSNPLFALLRGIRDWFEASGAPGLLPRLGALALVAVLVGWQAGWAPVLAQAITGTPGAADATTTISGNQLPAPAPPFGGVIKDAALQSRPWWAPRITPPPSAPNVLLIITDDAGFGVPSTFGGVIPTPAMERVAKAGLRYNRMFSTALCSPTRHPRRPDHRPQPPFGGFWRDLGAIHRLPRLQQHH